MACLGIHFHGKKLRRRPEIDLKYKLAGLFDLNRMFPGQSSMWGMTAAQRMLLLEPKDETPAVKRLSMEEMEEMRKKALEERAAREGGEAEEKGV